MKRSRIGLLSIIIALAMVFMVACSSPGATDTPEATAEPAVEEPVAEPTEEPAEEAPVEEPAEEPTEAPAEEPAAEPTEEPAEEAAAAEPVELHFAWWGSQSRHDRTIEVINMFMEEHPNITITYEFASFADYWPLLATKAAAGELPDVIQQDYAYFTQYVRDGLIIPLDPYVDDGTIDLSNVPEGALEGGIIDGQLYALNLGTNSQSFVIDVDKFEEAGVALPEPDWTWADFEETNLALHEALGIYGTAGGLENPQIVNTLFLSRGEGLYSDDGTALGYTDDQILVDYFDMQLRLQEAGALLPREEAVANAPTLENNELVSGNAAMYFAHTNQLVALWTAAGEDRNLMMVPVPRANDATQSANYLKASMFFSISAHSEHPVESAMFIDYFTNSVEANEILGAERGVPVSTVVQDALRPLMTVPQLATFDFLNTIEVSPIRPPDPPAHNDLMSNVFTPQVVDPILYGQLPSAEGVELFRSEATALLGSQ